MPKLVTADLVSTPATAVDTERGWCVHVPTGAQGKLWTRFGRQSADGSRMLHAIEAVYLVHIGRLSLPVLWEGGGASEEEHSLLHQMGFPELSSVSCCFSRLAALPERLRLISVNGPDRLTLDRGGSRVVARCVSSRQRALDVDPQNELCFVHVQGQSAKTSALLRIAPW